MESLFPPVVEPSDIPKIPGLSYLPRYIDEREELRLAAAIDADPWDTSWDRRRQPYGAGYGNQSAPARPIPAWANELIERLRKDGIGDRTFDQLLVNEYLPGQGISLHRDHKPFDRTVVSLSLLSACVMDFRQPSENRRESLLLERCSLLVLSDDARYEWEHGIARRKSDRWRGLKLDRGRRLSVTLRIHKRGLTRESLAD